MNNSRNVCIDFLKICAMLMVIFEHLLIRSGALDSVSVNDFCYYVIWFLRAVAKVNVNTFVLISGYFLSCSVFSVKKLFQLIIQVACYSVCVYLIAVATGLVDFSASELAKSAVPILANRYWFVTCYISLYILVPALNMCIAQLNPKQLLVLIVIAYVVTCIYPNFYFLNYEHTGGGRTLTWFIILYFTAALIRREKQSYHRRTHLIFWVCVILTALVKYFADNMAMRMEMESLSALSALSFTNDSPFIYGASISLFLVAVAPKKEITLNSAIKKVVVNLASASLAVYLIHDHGAINCIWNKISVDLGHWEGWCVILLLPALVYFVCYLIERVRVTMMYPIINSKRFCELCRNCQKKLDALSIKIEA